MKTKFNFNLRLVSYSVLLLCSCNEPVQEKEVVKKPTHDTSYIDSTYYGIHIMKLKDSAYYLSDIIYPRILDSTIKEVSRKADRKWMETSLDDYRQIGFYKKYSALSATSLVDSIIKWRCEQLLRETISELAIFGDPRKMPEDLATQIGTTVDTVDTRIRKYKGEFDPSFSTAEIQLVRFDSEMVWWGQYDYGTLPGNNAYVKLLNDWSHISRGAFLPTEINEKRENGATTISFKLNGIQKSLTAYGHDGYIDVNILNGINRMLMETGMQFYIYDLSDSTLFVACLTNDQAKKLSGQKKWRFGAI